MNSEKYTKNSYVLKFFIVENKPSNKHDFTIIIV